MSFKIMLRKTCLLSSSHKHTQKTCLEITLYTSAFGEGLRLFLRIIRDNQSIFQDQPPNTFKGTDHFQMFMRGNHKRSYNELYFTCLIVIPCMK